jgi:Ca-activated chloride channel homolog
VSGHYALLGGHVIRFRVALAGLAAALVLPLPLRSQEPSQPGSQPPALPAPPVLFRAESNLVVLHVNVFNGRSDAVAGLPREAFHVLEENRPQDITFFNSTDVPVAVGLVIDNSSSMIPRRKMVLAGARAFLDGSHQEDEVFTIIFNEHVRLGLPETVQFTTNRQLLETTVTRHPPGGMTAIHDAVVAGLEHLQEATHQKRVLVVLSDGDDNASQHAEHDVVQRALRSDALVYTVSTGSLGANAGNRGLLRRLAESTGGVAYFPETEPDIVATFATIAENIRRGYSIGYVPTNAATDGRYRRVKVTVGAPGYRNLKVIARDGYFAPRAASTPGAR